MNPIKRKHILIGLAVAFILFLFCRIGDDEYSYDQTRNHTQGAIQSHTSYRSFDMEQVYSSTWSHNPSNRHEILQTKVKGYREETYWGEHTYVEYFDIHNDIKSIGDSAVFKYTLDGDKWTISSDWLKEEWERIE